MRSSGILKLLEIPIPLLHRLKGYPNLQAPLPISPVRPGHHRQPQLWLLALMAHVVHLKVLYASAAHSEVVVPALVGVEAHHLGAV